MKINVAKINKDGWFRLKYGWKGYNLNLKNIWVKETELSINYSWLFPICLAITTDVIIKVFEACPLTENRMIISLRHDDIFINAYLLVGDIVEDYKFKTIELTDDSSHDWLKI
jgi:hypothetical protein